MEVSAEDRVVIKDAIGQLTAKQRQALSYWLQGYTHQEISDRLAVGRPAASRLLGRAKARLAEQCNITDAVGVGVTRRARCGGRGA